MLSFIYISFLLTYISAYFIAFILTLTQVTALCGFFEFIFHFILDHCDLRLYCLLASLLPKFYVPSGSSDGKFLLGGKLYLF